MQLRNRTTGEVIDFEALRLAHPNVSFPQYPNEEIFEDFGLDIIQNVYPDSVPHRQYAPDGIEQREDGKWYVRYALLPVAPHEVDAEHDRRALAGHVFAITGYGDIALEGGSATQTVLLALKDTARDLIAADVTAPILMFTDRDNVDHFLTAGQVVELVDKGKAWMQAAHAAKRALKAMEPIPDDFADDGWWVA